ncbi:radical SAM protein [bacterium]|nr:radical SAM protein [bacterium]
MDETESKQINDNSDMIENEKQQSKNVYVSCELIEHGFMVDNSNGVRVCSIINKEYGGRPVIFENYTGEIIDKEKFFAIKRNHREKMKSGIPPFECTDCPMLIEKEWDDNDYIDNLLFAHWVDCNSRCIYCGATTEEFVRENYKYYDFTPAIEEMIKNGSLIKSAKIDFAGGEPTVYPEFERLLSVFLREGFSNIYVNTSGIKYSQSITRALKNNQITLTISIDAGTKKMHKKVKCVSSFDKVWANIYKYSKAQQEANSKEKICLKYVFVPKVNVQKREIDIFFKNVIKANVDYVALSLDMLWWEKHKYDNNEKLIKMANYFIEQSKEKNLKLTIYPWARWLLESGIS